MSVPGARAGKPAVLFFRYGAFSHINDSVLAALRLALPALTFEDIDLAATRSTSALSRLAVKGSLLAHYGPRRLAGRPTPGDAALKTPATFDQLSRAAREATQGYAGNCVATIQTQGLFNAKSVGVPHLLYTDHTHLTNLGYPAFDRRRLAAKAWIGREGSAFAAADAILVMSEHVRATLRTDYGVAPDRLHTVGVGINTLDALTRRKASRGRTVLFVGVDWERKGGPELVEAVGRARARFPNLRLTIAGCSPPGLPDYCDTVGRVPLDAVRAEMAAADLFCLPTKVEPFGIVVLEAMAARLPVVVSRLGAFPDFVIEGENGFFCDPLDVGSVAAAIVRALERGDLRAVGERARKSVVPRYTWPVVAERFGVILRDLIGVSGRADGEEDPEAVPEDRVPAYLAAAST